MERGFYKYNNLRGLKVARTVPFNFEFQQFSPDKYLN